MIDFEKIKHYFQLFRGMKMQDLEVLFRNSRRVRLSPGENLLLEGSQKRVVAYIEKGLVRSFAVNDKGDEVTMFLRWEDQYVASHDVLLFDRPSRFTYQAMEKTKLIVIEYDVIQEIIRNNPKFEQSRKYFLLKTIGELMDRLESFVLLSPEERYVQLIASNPSLTNRVPDKYLANIIGITPVSLSRIRKRIAEKKG
jgi:CRP-like cAMP-binding protein